MSETVVLLHGFAGTARHWDRVTALLDRERYSPLAIALAQVSPPSLAGAIEHVKVAAPERFILCGYSMGGRIALHVARALSDRIDGLVLISTSAGIEDPVERAERAGADDALAAAIECDGVEQFIARWRATPLFHADPDWVKDAIAQDTRRLRPDQLAATLRAYGAGRLPPLWDRLGQLEVAAIVLAGERDPAYVRAAERLALSLPHARREIVAGVGHRLALEAPAAVVAALTEAGLPPTRHSATR